MTAPPTRGRGTRLVVVATRSLTNAICDPSCKKMASVEVISHGRRKGSLRSTPGGSSAVNERPGQVLLKIVGFFLSLTFYASFPIADQTSNQFGMA